MTREELAYRAGVDRKTFYRYVKRHEDELLKWIVDSYGVTLDEE